MPRALAAVVLVLGLPRSAAACAVCIGSAFGDRGYTWPYIGLILMPFIVATAIVGVLAWQLGWRPRQLAARASAAFHSEGATPPRTALQTEGATPPRTPRHRTAPGDPSPSTHTETT